ncbi:MAG: response regulator [Magnetococcales bacterium]|nr:response regulator [Magnetococcales bacterium]
MDIDTLMMGAVGAGLLAGLAGVSFSLHKRLEQARTALRDLARSQEEQVRQRTRELSLALERAVAANQAKSDFLATVSHEIRTPMNVVLGMLELLREAPLNHDRLEQVRLAYGSGKTLLALIDNILDFSKIEADLLTLDEVDFDLRNLVDESALILATLAHAKGIELTPFFPYGMPTSVRGDVNRLRQIFTNLLGNAIKFTPEGGTVELHGGPTGAVNSQKTEYLFEVRDSGPGVPIQEREKIFDRFIQSDIHRRQGYTGTGLGLAISRRLVEMMGGEIGVDVNPYAQTGSIFHFSVQLAKQPVFMAHPPKSDLFQGVRVLGVEIDGLQRTFLDDVLTRFGARFNYVIEATTALDALRQAKIDGHPYDLVVLNQKPGRDARNICRQLRCSNAIPRFILLTDLMDQGWDQAAELPGISICLKKPISAERLRSAMEWVLHTPEGTPGRPVSPQHPTERPISMRYDTWILLVDDHAANLTVAKGMLTRLGCDPARVVTAADGREGTTRFQEKPFGLVFMDCQMPGMDGYQASRLIREWEQQQRKPPTPIVAFTANVTSDNRQQGERAGMSAFLAKPVTLSELQTVLEQFLTPAPPPGPPEPATREGTGAPREEHGPSTDLAILTRAMEAIGLPEEDFRDVAGLLANQLPELLESLKRNLTEGDYETAKATAHVLKGSMANTIFPQLQPHTRSLHETIKSQSWQEALEVLQRVHTHFTPIQTALESFLRLPPHTP